MRWSRRKPRKRSQDQAAEKAANACAAVEERRFSAA
jgi:hypothetical protein